MIGDLLDLLRAAQSAQSDQEKTERESAFRQAVEVEIQNLFQDPKYPNRRRSFGAIRKRLGVFDKDPDGLKHILFGMGALVYSGENDDAFWELPDMVGATNGIGNTIIGPSDPVKPPRRSRNWVPLIFLAICIVVVLSLWETVFSKIPIGSLSDLFEPDRTHADCVAKANGIMTEIIKCHQEFGEL